MAVWFDPWAELNALTRSSRLDALMGDMEQPQAAFPPVNVWTSPRGATITVELPGVDPDALDIAATGKTLTLKGHRKPDTPEKDATCLRCERPKGEFTRTITLPFEIDTNQIAARYQDGVLSITLERPASQQPRKVQIQRG